MNGKKYDYVGRGINIYFRSPYNTYRREGLIYLKVKKAVILKWERICLHSFAVSGFVCIKYISSFNDLTAFDLGDETANDLVFRPKDDKVIISHYKKKEQIRQNNLYKDWENFIISVFNLMLFEEPNITTHPFWSIINDDWRTHCKKITSYWKEVKNRDQNEEIILNQWFDKNYNYSECVQLNLLYKQLLSN